MSRRTSLFGAPGDGQMVKDPRPIKEKAYVMMSVQRLEQYLVENGYEKPLTQQQLMCPPSKDFFYMFEFLLRRVDVTFAFKDAKKMEEETPVLFKALKYPFGMSARSLHSVGTPHAWPTFLAALHWMVELLTYYEVAEMHRMAAYDEDPTSPESLRYSFFEFVGEAYSAFMSFDDREAQLELEFVRSLLDRNRERAESTSRTLEHTVQIQEETTRLRNQETRVAKLVQSLEASTSELEKLKADVAKVKAENESSARKLAEVKARGSSQREAVERLQMEIGSLDRLLRTQAEQGLDAEKLKTQKEEVKQAIIGAMNRRDEVEQSSSAIEMEISEKYREVERGVSALNALLETTELVKTLGGEIRVQPQSPTSILSMDIKLSVKPVLLAFLEDKRKLHQQNQPVLVEMQTKADQKKEEVAMRRGSLAELKAKMDRETIAFHGFKDSLHLPRKEMDAQIAELEREIGTLALSSKDLLATRKKDYTELQLRTEQMRAIFEKEEVELNDQMERYLDWFLNHKEAISAKIDLCKSVLEKQAYQ